MINGDLRAGIQRRSSVRSCYPESISHDTFAGVTIDNSQAVNKYTCMPAPQDNCRSPVFYSVVMTKSCPWHRRQWAFDIQKRTSGKEALICNSRCDILIYFDEHICEVLHGRVPRGFRQPVHDFVLRSSMVRVSESQSKVGKTLTVTLECTDQAGGTDFHAV